MTRNTGFVVNFFKNVYMFTPKHFARFAKALLTNVCVYKTFFIGSHDSLKISSNLKIKFHKENLLYCHEC